MTLQLAVVFAFVAITQCAPSNPCDPNPCVRGLCYRPSVSLGFFCSCEEGFYGDTCQYGPCDSSPCAEGTCLTSSVQNSYTCMCPPHKGGTNCEIALDACDNNPCLNGALCMTSNSDLSQYICLCASGYSGSNCENLSAAPCDSSPCLNGGSCTSASDGGYNCTCGPLFIGAQCQQPNLACTSAPCMNSGSCQPTTGGGYTCACRPLYTGSHCEERIDPCLNNLCQNGGTCQEEADSGYSCKCDPRFGGALCSLQMTCALNPCKNGGSCYLNYNDGINYMCKCPDNFKGNDCSKPDPCSSSPCANDSVCLTEEDGSYSCLCRCGTDGSCSNANNGGDGGSTPSQNETQCDKLRRASGNCTGRGRCAFHTNQTAFCICDASFYGIHCQYTVNPTPNGCGDSDGDSIDTTTPGGDDIGTGTFNDSFMCNGTTDRIGCLFVFTDMNKCNYHGCCSSNLLGGAKCRCRDGYGGNKCQHDYRNGCSSSNENAANENEGAGGTGNGGSGTDGAGTGGAGSGGTGTSGTGTNSNGGVRPLVELEFVVCDDAMLPTYPIVACGRVQRQTNSCTGNRGCCSVDEDGDARCRCYEGFGGDSCEFTCADHPDYCGTAN